MTVPREAPDTTATQTADADDADGDQLIPALSASSTFYVEFKRNRKAPSRDSSAHELAQRAVADDLHA